MKAPKKFETHVPCCGTDRDYDEKYFELLEDKDGYAIYQHEDDQIPTIPEFHDKEEALKIGKEVYFPNICLDRNIEIDVIDVVNPRQEYGLFVCDGYIVGFNKDYLEEHLQQDNGKYIFKS